MPALSRPGERRPPAAAPGLRPPLRLPRAGPGASMARRVLKARPGDGGSLTLRRPRLCARGIQGEGTADPSPQAGASSAPRSGRAQGQRHRTTCTVPRQSRSESRRAGGAPPQHPLSPPGESHPTPPCGGVRVRAGKG